MDRVGYLFIYAFAEAYVAVRGRIERVEHREEERGRERCCWIHRRCVLIVKGAGRKGDLVEAHSPVAARGRIDHVSAILADVPVNCDLGKGGVLDLGYVLLIDRRLGEA